jgi:flagellar protein FliS
MFATTSRFASPAQSLGGMYRKTGVEITVHSATPHRLVGMLFDGLLEAIAQARGAIQSNNIDVKGRAIGRAISILDEGLKAALNLQEGGRIAADLDELYAYMTLRLTQANLRNDESALQEVKALVQPLQQAWADIGPKVDKAAV